MPIIRCAIYCTVIDNFGDIGVCWRLAKQLQQEHHLSVSLWVDDLASMAQLVPSLNPSLNHQVIDHINIYHWENNNCFDANNIYQLVIEGFACRMPPLFLQQLALQKIAPVWLNLEYLTAETWIESCHLQASTHPNTGLIQHFYFPGFTPATGGLLREQDLIDQHKQLQQSSTLQQQFWQTLAIPSHLQACCDSSRKISLFSYPNPQIYVLLDALVVDKQPTLLFVPYSKSISSINHYLNENQYPAITSAPYNIHIGNLQLVVLPFLTPTLYDQLLGLCDLNIVRGEDSLVRALWAGRPLLWHIYPQTEDNHHEKLNAFIAYVNTLIPEHLNSVFEHWQQVMLAWNKPNTTPNFAVFFNNLQYIQLFSHTLCKQQQQYPDLASQLMQFYQQKRVM